MDHTTVPRASIAQVIHQEFMDHIEDIDLSVELAEKATDNVLAVLNRNAQKDSLHGMPKVSRVEVINYNEGGRVYTRWGVQNVLLSVQDNGQTLKVFIGVTHDFNFGGTS